ESEPETTERDGEQDSLDLLLAPERVRDEEANRRRAGHAEGEAGPVRRLPLFAVAIHSGGSSRTARGSIQRLTSMSAPNPMRIATKPSVIGPTSPSEKPPGFSGFLRYST